MNNTPKTVKASVAWPNYQDDSSEGEYTMNRAYRIIAIKRGDATRAYTVQSCTYVGRINDPIPDSVEWRKRGTQQFTLAAARDLRAFFEKHDADTLRDTIEVIE